MIKQLILKLLSKFKRPHRYSGYEAHVTNLHKSPNDSRDYTLHVTSVLPEKHSLTELAEIKSQGSIGSCASFAICTAMEMLYKINEYVIPQDKLSELFHYYIVRQDDFGNTYPADSGQYLRDGLRVSQKIGITAEILHPYNVHKFNKKPSMLATSFARFYKSLYYYRLKNIQEIKNAIAMNLPVIVGLRVTFSFLRPSSFLYEHKYLQQYGGHAVVVTAYNDKDRTFEIVNSWGKSWGNNGTIKIRYIDFEKLYFEAWTMNIKNGFR